MKVEKRVLTPDPPPFEIVLTLTEREAEALVFLVGKIGGGHPVRNVTDDIYTALKKLGVDSPTPEKLYKDQKEGQYSDPKEVRVYLPGVSDRYR